MCKYCEKLYSGNSSMYLNCAKIFTNEVFAGSLVSFIEENDADQPILCTILMNDHGELIASDYRIVALCPVCGRDFTKN